MNSEEKDDGMTPEERLAWLRERGVEVVTPDERKASHVADALRQADHLVGEAIYYVKIPYDSSKSFEELVVKSSEVNGDGDVLVEHLKAHFREKSDQVDLSLLATQATQTLAGSAEIPAVSESALLQVAQEGNVETFALVRPSPSNGFIGVNMYLDEIGMLKRLPLNTRASEYAARAGYNPPPQFYGNVYLGRKHRNRNLSLRLNEMRMDATWLQDATTDNLNSQMEHNRITGWNELQSGVDGFMSPKHESGYSWTQTEEELEVIVLVPSDTTSKQIKVDFRPQNVHVVCQQEERLALKLFERVDVDACTWTLDAPLQEGKKKLILSMEKLEGALWPRIVD